MFTSVFTPAVTLMRRLPLAHKFAWVCLAFMAPLVYLLYTVVSDRRAAFEFTEREVMGITAIQAFDGAFVPVMSWRGAFVGSTVKQAGALERRDKSAAEADKEFVVYEKYLQQSGDPLALGAEFAKLRKQWDATKSVVAKSPHEALEQADAMVGQVRGFLELTAKNSNLALDPDADTYALMLAYTSEVPRLMDSLSKVRSLGRYLADGQISDDAEMFMALHNADALMNEYVGRAQSAYADAAAANAQAVKALDVEALALVGQKVVPRIDTEFAWGAAPKANGTEWGNTLNEVLGKVESLHAAGGTVLATLLMDREERLAGQIWTALAVSVLFILLGMYLLTGFYAAAVSTLGALGRRIAKLGQGDLTSSAGLQGNDELARAGNQLTEAMGKLALLVGEVRSTADEIGGSVEQIAAANQDLSRRGAQLAAVVEQTSASTGALEETVGENLASAHEANELVQSAASLAGKGGAVVEQAVRAMNDITGSSQKIGDIIQVIDTIAFQTNILALNAAVEAARAGEQGRGFAVVASEVRALAQRSAGAAREIKGLIEDSISNVHSGGQYVNQAGSTMSEMVRAIERVTTLVGDITRQSNGQARQIRELGAAIREVDSAVQQNAAMVEETAAAANSLNDRARSLAAASAQFTTH